MDNAVGSDNNETNIRERSVTSDDDQEDEGSPLHDLPDDVRLIVEGEVELSTEQREAAGHLKYELIARKRYFTANGFFSRHAVEAIAPPSELDYDVPQLNVIHAACFVLWGGCPPDHATIRAMGAVEHRALLRYLSKEWRMCGAASGASSGAARSAQTFLDFKEKAIEMNGGREPDEAFFTREFKVRYRDYKLMDKPESSWYFHLSLCGPQRRTDLWVEDNKQWLEDHGVFSAWEKHRASADFVVKGGYSAEVSGRSTAITPALNQRLQGEEFVYPKDGKRYKVLVVRWIPDREQFAVLCYEARLADPTKDPKSRVYIGRMKGECFSASVEDVDDWIERSPKRARI